MLGKIIINKNWVRNINVWKNRIMKNSKGIDRVISKFYFTVGKILHK